MKIQTLFLILIMGILMSCSKDDDEEIVDSTPTTPEPQEISYMPAGEGSYWVYDTYKIDPSGDQTIQSQNDTVFALGDTIISGHTYDIYYGKPNPINLPGYTYLRDSSGYILSSTGSIILSNTNFTDVLQIRRVPDQNPLFSYVSKMEPHYSLYDVPAGLFLNLLNRRVTFYHLDGGDSTLVGAVNNYFAPNVGPITRTIFYTGQFLTNQIYYEDRLVAYNIATP